MSPIVGTIDSSSQVWASLLTGEAGFVQAVTEDIVRINTASIPGDPFSENLLLQDEIGIVVIDLVTRRRLRINGKAEQLDGGIYVHIKQVYFNCPQYIQARISVWSYTLKPQNLAPPKPPS